MGVKRLSQGGLVDRSAPLNFTWDGQRLQGLTGDSLASALLANEQWVLGRSFKYHRPRGVMSAGVEESGALLTVGEGDRKDPNVRATTQPLFDGLVASGQNAWPNVRYDVGAINSLFSPFYAAGFYYKTFMGLPPFEWGKGTWLWMQYEKLIRKAAGMGTLSRAPDPDHYDHAHLFCDVLVVGGGVAGLTAATQLAAQGVDVVLCEQDVLLGGDLLNQPNSTVQIEALTAAARDSGVRLMANTTVFGLYDHGVAGALERLPETASPAAHQVRQIFWTIRAQHTVVATGALERSYAFGNNDRPRVLTANAGRAYLNRYALRLGESVVISGNNDGIYGTAFDLAKAGADVALYDVRAKLPGQLVKDAEDAGVRVRSQSAVCNVAGHVARAVEIGTVQGDGFAIERKRACDLVLASGGWSPVIHLLAHRGAKPIWHADLCCFVVESTQEAISVCGSAAAYWQTEDCIRSAEAIVPNVLASLSGESFAGYRVGSGGHEAEMTPLYEAKVCSRKLKAFVDPQHDVSASDVRLAHREGFVSVEHLKRYTTLGMSNDGGKMGNVIGLALMADALGKDIPDVGTTRFRPPYTSVALGALSARSVGKHFRPLRRTALHDWNLRHGATMTEAGLWQRPWYFAREGETITEAYIREATTVRKTVGLCDVTSLGKIAVQGPDAAEFLNRIYINGFAKLAVGKARYGIMLRDDGFVMDDGTTWRLGEEDFFMTTTTAHAAKVMVWLEELLQLRWPELKVHVASVSDQWAGVAVAGPQSRAVLEAVLAEPDVVSDEALPFMGVVETTLKSGVQVRIARISFSGERAFEIYCGSGYAEHMMEGLWAAAEPLDGCLYGLEALGALRIEKGHVTGAELDGRVTLEDAGFAKMASTKKPYVGNVLRQRPAMQREGRPQLVGILPKDRSGKFNAGAILCKPDQISGHGEGWITAVTHSPVMGHWIGLGYITGGAEAWQQKAAVAADPLRLGNVEVEIVSPHMYDPSGEKMRG
ncbi:MAG: (2Fe-2S)-binding protein [Gammaproteobacteria bacterium]|nr:(2Fe-2S)-binding protein [Gammaproteobacteria bacterium]